MGRYLDIIDRVDVDSPYDINDINDQTHHVSCVEQSDHNQQYRFGRISRLCRTLSELERRCPDGVPTERWRIAIDDGRRFLPAWGEQAESLGWTARDLFGLHEVPANPGPRYQRLSRYDCTGLIWLLQKCPIVALTEATAAIRMPTGSILTYRKFNKPAFGPLGDSIDDFLDK
jgi:hypothetical protein